MTGPRGPRRPYADLVDAPIEPSEVLARVEDPAHGAALLFLGVVRDHDQDRAVSGLRYEAYEEMALGVLREIASQAAERLGSPRVAVVHRVGELEVGEVSVAIAVSSPHRAETYETSRWVIEEIKERLPIWKKERYVEGDEAWVPGVRPRAAPEAAGEGPATGGKSRHAILREPAETEAP